ncbi:hypothetical protein VPH35_065725 [Triticum aestivum]
MHHGPPPPQRPSSRAAPRLTTLVRPTSGSTVVRPPRPGGSLKRTGLPSASSPLLTNTKTCEHLGLLLEFTFFFGDEKFSALQFAIPAIAVSVCRRPTSFNHGAGGERRQQRPVQFKNCLFCCFFFLPSDAVHHGLARGLVSQLFQCLRAPWPRTDAVQKSACFLVLQCRLYRREVHHMYKGEKKNIVIFFEVCFIVRENRHNAGV